MKENNLTVNMEDFFSTSLIQYDEFDKKAWAKGTGYLCPKFPILDEKIEGLDAGLFMIAGESNAGKSSFTLALAYEYAMCESNKLYCLYFALDDTAEDIMAKVIAMTQQIPISVATKPQRYQDMIDQGHENTAIYQDWLKKRNKGIKHLKEINNRFKVIDGTMVENAEQILDYCRKAQIYVKSIDPENNILVVIDSLSDLQFASRQFKSDKELNDHIAKQVKKWAVEILDVPIFGTLHLRKIDQNKRPTVADVKESGRYVYEASALFLVHNDVSRNKQSASIYITEEDSPEKLPIIELDWAKNKKSSFKGRTYYIFQTNLSRITECSKESTERFNHLIYGV